MTAEIEVAKFEFPNPVLNFESFSFSTSSFESQFLSPCDVNSFRFFVFDNALMNSSRLILPTSAAWDELSETSLALPPWLLNFV